MDKYQKAFKTILEDLHPDGGLTTLKEVELIEELIDKEIPMKPKSVNYCNNCNKHLYNQDYIDRIDYCKHCGQKLDWSSENETK